MSKVPIPPVDAKVNITCCEYCPVACAYKVYSWPVGRDGGRAADENAYGKDIPVGALSGFWPSEEMHTVTEIEGSPHNVIVLPDADMEVVNVGGTHSIRGGALAKKIYSPDGLTADRLQRPLLRVRGELVPIPWDMALDLIANLSRYTVDTFGELAWGMKIYSYQYYENVFAGSKLARGAIGTPNYSPHHAPAAGDDVPGLSDVGIDAFGSAFEDDKEADVILIAGSDPYETKSVRFTTWTAAGGAKLIYIDPRKTFTAQYALNHGGMHLQLTPGTDVVLFSALAREILANGWEDTEFVDRYVASREELDQESKYRKQLFGQTAQEFKDFIMAEPDFALDRAEEITGVPATDIKKAAEILSGGDGPQPKTMLLFEKGLYWSHNYENTAVIGNLGVILGATGRPGRATSRMGGHQRGGQSGAGYPLEKSPHSYEGHPIEMDTEEWLVQGNTRFRWIVGTNWLGAMGASHALIAKVAELVRRGPQVTSTDPATAEAQLRARMDAGGMVIVQSDIYLNDSTEYADIILPAATWGEETFARNNAERRLRIYEKFMDPPGEAKPDWWAFAQVAQRMGFEGFDWKESNDIFEAAGPRSEGGRRNFLALVEKAQAEGVKAHDLLRSYGTKGLQTPLGMDDSGELTETVRLHENLKFKSDSGKLNFIRPDWATVKARNEAIGPDTSKGEVWVLNGRVNAVWNNMFDHVRRAVTRERWPVNFIEVNPEDARSRGIVSGDMLSIESDNVLDQLGNKTTGAVTAVAYVSDSVPPGVTFVYFNFPGSPANSLTSADSTLQPIARRYNFKLGKGKLTKIGSTELGEIMSFVPRNLAPQGS